MMEITNSLIENLAVTRTVKELMTSISDQIGFLMNWLVNVDGKIDLSDKALAINRSLLSVSRQASVIASRNERLKSSMPSACQSLEISADSLIVACHRIHSDGATLSNKQLLVSASKDALQSTLKVLLTIDEGTVSQILDSIQLVRESLYQASVSPPSKLVATFRSFTDNLLVLLRRVDERTSEVASPSAAQLLLQHRIVLTKCVPLLSSALQTKSKYQDDYKAKQSLQYASSQVELHLTELANLLTNKVPKENQSGSFVQAVDALFSILSRARRHELNVEVVEKTVKEVLLQSMMVAHLSDETNLISEHSQKLIAEQNRLKSSLALQSLAVDDCCTGLTDQLVVLEASVNYAVLLQFIITFAETVEPLERLIKANSSPIVGNTVRENYRHNFESHCEMMCQIGRLAAACSPDEKRVKVCLRCVTQLEQLEPELSVLVASSGQSYYENLAIFRREWMCNSQLLCLTLDEMIDHSEFIKASLELITRDCGRLQGSSHHSVVTMLARRLLGCSRRLFQVASKSSPQVMPEFDGPLNSELLLVKTSLNSFVRASSNKEELIFKQSCISLLAIVERIATTAPLLNSNKLGLNGLFKLSY